MLKKLPAVTWLALLVIVLAVPLAVLAQDGDGDVGTAYVLVGNFSPNSPAVDIYINDDLIGENLFFSEATFPVEVAAGDIYIVVRDAAAAVTDPPIVAGYKSVSENNYYMVPVMNVLEQAQLGAYRIPVYEALGPDQTRAQFFHAVPDYPRIDVWDADDDSRLVYAMGYVEEPDVVDLTAGTYDFQFWTQPDVLFPNGQTPDIAAPNDLIIDTGHLDLQERVVYSFFVIGSPLGDPPVLALVLAMPYGGGQPVAPPGPPGTPTPTPGGPTLTPTITPGGPTLTPTSTATNTPTPTPEPTVEFSSAAYTVGEEDGTATLTVSISAVQTDDVTVDYTTGEVSADEGVDYDDATGTLTIPAGDLSATFDVTIHNDTDIEGDEDFEASLSNPSTGVLLGDDDVTTVTIDDNETPVTVSIESISLVGLGTETDEYEEGETARVRVELSEAAATTIGVDYEITGGSAESNDYTLEPQADDTFRLAFDAGETVATFDIDITDDLNDEPEETITFAISNVTGPATLASPTSDSITILEDLADEEDDITVNITDVSPSTTGSEGTILTITVELSSVSTESHTVTYSATNVTTADADYIIEDGTDPPDPLVFSVGETEEQIQITLVDDGVVEGQQTFTITLDSVTGTAIIGIDDAVDIIIDD